ncbi:MULTISPECIES: hypothetical protein [Lysobacter]|uniref:Uncharacterized protein n=1 Tax=Lysobacter firmicutimachus TaxID=1792846 RepID=A0ABU8CY45_9GAMM|nr:hypothetical protein [Lysobacter antibioticus]
MLFAHRHRPTGGDETRGGSQTRSPASFFQRKRLLLQDGLQRGIVAALLAAQVLARAGFEGLLG